jgi:hypothetical protein
MCPEPIGHHGRDTHHRGQESVPASGWLRLLVIEHSQQEIFLECGTAGEVYVHRFAGKAEPHILTDRWS